LFSDAAIIIIILIIDSYIPRSRHMLDFNEDGPAPVGASLRFLNRSRPYMRLFSLSQHHLLHLVGNSQNKWACNYSPRVWLLSCTPRPKKKKITIEWICNQTIQKKHKEKRRRRNGRFIREICFWLLLASAGL
jgi:hypothetical protein